MKMHPLNPSHPYRNGTSVLGADHVVNGALGVHAAMALPQAAHNRARLNRHRGLGFMAEEDQGVNPYWILIAVGLAVYLTMR